MHISKARQLLGLLNFCLLSGAESEMERIDLLSTGGALPRAGPLTCSLAWLPCSGLSFSVHPTFSHHSRHHPLNLRPYSLTFSLSLSLSISAWRLPLLQLTLVLQLLGEMCAELLTPGLIFLLFPISSISSSWRLWRRQRMSRGWG